MLTEKTISLTGLRCICRIGIHPHERISDQAVLIDISLTQRPETTLNDRIEEVLDYDRLREAALKTVAEGPYDLLETLCLRIIERLKAYSAIQILRVSVYKPDIFDDCDKVGITYVYKAD